MTPVIQKFLELEQRKADVKKYFDELNAATAELAAEIGVSGHFQDAEGVVYQVVIPKGTFVEYKQIGYVRTRRLSAEEKKGDLSLSAARELGYEVEGK